MDVVEVIAEGVEVEAVAIARPWLALRLTGDLVWVMVIVLGRVAVAVTGRDDLMGGGYCCRALAAAAALAPRLAPTAVVAVAAAGRAELALLVARLVLAWSKREWPRRSRREVEGVASMRPLKKSPIIGIPGLSISSSSSSLSNIPK